MRDREVMKGTEERGEQDQRSFREEAPLVSKLPVYV